MDSNSDETSHVVIFGLFENNRKYKERIVNEIKIVICAMLNSSGGKVVIDIDTESIEIPEASPFSKTSLLIRILEQYMTSIIGTHLTVSRIEFKLVEDSIVIIVRRANSFVTINYNLYLPSQTQVVQISPSEPLENIKNVISRKEIAEPIRLGSHRDMFFQNSICGLQDNKIIELKNVKAGPSKRTTLADRMTGKGNKFTCYVSAFANHNGGHIYYGIRDDGVVEGEFIPNEKNKEEIIKKVEKVINKMIWPEQIGQPKRGEHWEIFFQPVVDENSKPVPSTFVIVIYIAPCLGGVFTEEPECYEIVEGMVSKISFENWKKRILEPVWLRKSRIPHSIPRVTWSSETVRKAFTVGYEKLRQLINNGDWDAFSKTCQHLEKQSDSREVSLVVLSKRTTACYAKGKFHDASVLLETYKEQLSNIQDMLTFEVIYFNLIAAVKRASGDFKGLAELLTEALSKAELIKPGLVTATLYIFAGSVTDLINLEKPTDTFSPEVLSRRALKHLEYVRDFPTVVADKKQRAHINLATFHLGCNLSGQPTKNSVDISQAKDSIMAVHDSILEGNPLSRYREVQFKLVQSIYYYRHAQVTPDNTVSLLRNAFNCANEAECLARQYQFAEMVEWSKRNKALCTEELVKEKLLELKLRFTFR